MEKAEQLHFLPVCTPSVGQGQSCLVPSAQLLVAARGSGGLGSGCLQGYCCLVAKNFEGNHDALQISC